MTYRRIEDSATLHRTSEVRNGTCLLPRLIAQHTRSEQRRKGKDLEQHRVFRKS